MKKFGFKTSLYLVVLVVALLLAGCSSGDGDNSISAPDGTVAVTNDAIHFYVCHPQDWVCSRNDGMITITPPSGSGSKASVSIRESAAMSQSDVYKLSLKGGDESAESNVNNIPCEYWEQIALEELKGSGAVHKVLQTEERKLGGALAYQVEYSIEMNKETYVITQIFAYKEIDSSHRIFTVTYTASQKDKENQAVDSAYNTIVNNFNFKED